MKWVIIVFLALATVAAIVGAVTYVTGESADERGGAAFSWMIAIVLALIAAVLAVLKAVFA